MKIDKRGVSAVVATVLLIMLVMILVAIILAWARGFVGDKTEEARVSSDQLCDSVDLSVVVISAPSANERNLEVVNRGNVNVSLLEFKIYYGGGDSSVVNSSIGVLAGSSVEGVVNFGVNITGGTVEEIEIFPVLDVGSPKLVTCRQDSFYLKLA
jgi:FlaG/FlaF family flagellin (archaellin)